MMIRSSAVLFLLAVVNAEEGYYFSNQNQNQINSVNNFGGQATTTTNNFNNNNGSGYTYTNNNGNTYTNMNGGDPMFNQQPMPVDTFGQPAGGSGNPFGGMDQHDDLTSALSMYGADMMTMMFGQCLNNIDINKLMDDPFADVKNRCSDQQAATFNSALDTFNTCAGFDLKELIEDLGSVYIGILLNCGSYAISVEEELEDIGMGFEDMQRLKAKESPLPRVPQECVDALVGDNPFGTAFLYAEEYPEREQKCFSELAGKLPMCALSQWPVPIVGSWLSAFSCIYGNANDVIMPLAQDALKSELKLLDTCLPQQISASNCKEIRNKCIFDDDLPATAMALPPPFWSPPMSQTYKNLAAKDFGNLPERYESFRQTCVPAADLAVWDIAAGHQEKNKGIQGGASYYMEPSSEDENEKDANKADADGEELGAAAAAPPAAAASFAACLAATLAAKAAPCPWFRCCTASALLTEPSLFFFFPDFSARFAARWRSTSR